MHISNFNRVILALSATLVCSLQLSHMFGCHILPYSSPLPKNKRIWVTSCTSLSEPLMTSILPISSTPFMTPPSMPSMTWRDTTSGYLHCSYVIVHGILFLLSYTRPSSCFLDIHTSLADCVVYSRVKLLSISPNASRVTGPCAPVDTQN